VLAQLGWSEVPAWLIPKAKPDLWCLLASLHDTVLGRGFNPMEAAFMVKKLRQHFSADTLCRSYLPLLGLTPSRPQLGKTLSLCALETPWQEMVAQNRLSPEAGAVLSQWASPDRQAVLPWYQSLQLSFSKQLELLDYLTTLSRRAGNSPAAWLARPELAKLLADQVLTRSEKSNRLWERLRGWCFPHSSRAQQQFQQYLKALKLYQHAEMRLMPPPAFEDSTFRLELRFQDKSQLARQLQQLQEILDQPEFAALLDL
jgi:hypothetical protein